MNKQWSRECNAPLLGFAPWLSFSSIIFTSGRVAFFWNLSGQKLPSPSRQPKYPVPIFHTISAPCKW